MSNTMLMNDLKPGQFGRITKGVTAQEDHGLYRGAVVVAGTWEGNGTRRFTIVSGSDTHPGDFFHQPAGERYEVELVPAPKF